VEGLEGRALPAGVGPASIITTVVGNGTMGYSGDGGPAILASLNGPVGAAVDGAGHLYFAERGDSRVREVDLGTGVITTIAGNGNAGYNGDGGPATAASLFDPSGVALDPAGGLLYIADEANARVRAVDLATGIITTVAGTGTRFSSGDGGPASSASLTFPTDVAVDHEGHLFIADYPSRVRQVNLGTGVITTVAGNGTVGYGGDGGPATGATLNGPLHIALDGSGHLFIGDFFNTRVRQVDLATGVITTVAGNGTVGSSGDGGPATVASLNGPSGVAADAAGNLFISELNRVRQVDLATGIITTLAGNGTEGYGGDGGPAADALLSSPSGLAVDGAGNLFITEPGNSRIREVVLSAAEVTAMTISSNHPEGTSYGQQVTFTANVVAVTPATGVPTGSVTFLDGSTVLGTATLSGSGSATLTTRSLAGGTHTITSVYLGDNHFHGSSSPALSQVVDQAATNTKLTSSDRTSVYGESVTFTANVKGPARRIGTPTGSVIFLDGTTPLATEVPLDGTGTATFTTSDLSVGTHAISAVYGGDGTFTTSTSTTLDQVVKRAKTAISLESSVNPSVVGDSVTITVTVGVVAPGSGTPTGFVHLVEGRIVALVAPLLGDGTAIFNPSFSAGTHRLRAIYDGDANFQAVTSTVFEQEVSPAPAAPTMTASSSAVDPAFVALPVDPNAANAISDPASLRDLRKGRRAGSPFRD